MRRALYIRLAALFLRAGFAAAPLQKYAFSRVKDLVEVEGIRDNMLVGCGLEVGLNGSADSLKNAPFTQQSLQTMLERMGVNVRGTAMQTKNVTANFLNLTYHDEKHSAFAKPHNVNRPQDQLLDARERERFDAIAGKMIQHLGYAQRLEYVVNY